MRIEFGTHRPAPLRAMAVLAAAALLGTAGFSLADAAGPGGASTVVPLAPERILDTRTGVGQAAAGPVDAGQTIRLQVAGVGSIPADATGVVLNITATRATAPSWVAAWPSGTSRPDTSILNFGPGGDIANMITATLGADGAIDLYNDAGSVDLVADVAGYLSPGGAGGGVPGPAGPQGAAGLQGPIGPQGPGAMVFATTLVPGAGPQTLGSFGSFSATVSCTAPFSSISITSVNPGEPISLYGTTVTNSTPDPFIDFVRQNSTTSVGWLTAPTGQLSADALLARSGGEYFHLRVESTNSAVGCNAWVQVTPGILS